MSAEMRWKRRVLPPTTCDQCKREYAESPELCVRVLIEHPLMGETICLRCAGDLPITGCRFLHWGDKAWPVPYVLGTQTPPADWPHAKPAAQEIVRALSSSGFLQRVPEAPTRLDVGLELSRDV